VKHLLSVEDLGSRQQIEEMLDLTESFVAVQQREIPKVPALRGKVVVSLFYEDSTRTRVSFETAAKRLSADAMVFTVSNSSVKKGESLLDTVQTIEAMGIDAIVMRHSASGAPHRVAQWTSASVVNAGDGRHEHPTQALLDAFTLRRHRGPSLDGCRVAIIGDIRNSRVARSTMRCFATLGADVTFVAPPTLLPERLDGWPVRVSHDLDEELAEIDVAYVLRVQAERLGQALLPSMREYYARYGLTAARAARMKPDTFVMHAGPMIRGPEIATEVVDGPQSLVREQVTNGVAVRMAVLWSLIGSGGRVV
jgi:aspartate carbamoyltransferase catalytic subunit